jgi:16S rRNA (guanine527-N7)-methyltransferase
MTRRQEARTASSGQARAKSGRPAEERRDEPAGVDGADLRRQLRDAAAVLHITLPVGAIDQLVMFVGLLERWSRIHNLSAIEDRASILSQHLADSLSIVPLVQRWRPAGGSLVDVGSGAGLPGAVLAIALPGWQVACVDSVGKKSAFVQHVAGELGLRNLHALHSRVEDLRPAAGDPASSEPSRRYVALMPGGADLIVSRAFASLGAFVRGSSGLIRPDGAWLAMKGRRPDPELAEIDRPGAAAEVFHVEPLQVPGLDAERCAVWLRPRSVTPNPDHKSGARTAQ